MIGNNLLSGTNLGAGDDVTLQCFGFETGGSFIDPTTGGFIDPTTGGFIDPTTGGFETGLFTSTGGFIDPTGGTGGTGGFIDPTTSDGGFIDPTTGGFSFDSEDYLVSWTAPNAGVYALSLAGSDYDTVLGVLNGCEGKELDCNDDCFQLQSGITIDMEAGEQIILVIEGYGGQTGMFNININPGMANCAF